MINLNLIWLLVLIAIVVSFAGFITFGYISSKKSDNKYSFLNQFPFEINRSGISKVFAYLIGGFSFLPLIVVIPLFNDFGGLSVYSVFVTCVMGLAGLTISTICVLSTRYLKQHIISATVLMAMAFLCAALACIYSSLVSSINMRFARSGGFYIALAVLAGLLAALMVVVMFSPKLKDWAKLSEEIIDNEKVYSRGKFFPLAYSEWIAIAVIFLSQIIFLLAMVSM